MRFLDRHSDAIIGAINVASLLFLAALWLTHSPLEMLLVYPAAAFGIVLLYTASPPSQRRAMRSAAKMLIRVSLGLISIDAWTSI